MDQNDSIEFKNQSSSSRLNYLKSFLCIAIGITIFAYIGLLADYIGNGYSLNYDPAYGTLIISIIVFCLFIGFRKTLKRIQIDYTTRKITVEYIWMISPVRRWVIPFEHLQIVVEWQEDKADEIASVILYDALGPLITITPGSMGLPAITLKELKVRLTAITTANRVGGPTIHR